MATKRSVRILALILALLMVPVFGISALADDEAPTFEDKIIAEADFEGKDAVGGSHEFSSVETEGEEGAENDYAHIPFIGTATAASGANGSGNYDKFLTVIGDSMSYATDKIVVLEAKYRPHFVLLSKDSEAPNYCGYDYSAANPSDPTVEAQFRAASSGDGTSKNFISLYMLNLRTGHLSMMGTRVADAQPLVADQWNTVKLIIDLESATYTTYVNGELYAENGHISATNDSQGLYNVSVDANMLLIGKCNKSVGAYLSPELMTEGKDVTYCDIDDISLYRYTETVTVTVDGEATQVLKGSMITLAKPGKTLISAVVTLSDETTYKTANANIAAIDDMTITTEWLDGEFTVFRNFEDLNEGDKLSTAHGYTQVPNVSRIFKENDGANTYVRIPFVGKDDGYADDSNYDKSIYTQNPAISADGTVTIEVDYRPHFYQTTSAAPTIEAQFGSYSFKDADGVVHKNGQYLNLFTINVKTGDLSTLNSVKVANPPKLNLDEWNTVKVVFHAQSGLMEVYVNGVLHNTTTSMTCQYYDGGWKSMQACTEVVPNANSIIVAKCNKNKGAYAAAGTDLVNDPYNYIDVDNIRVYESPKLNVNVNGEEIKVSEGSFVYLSNYVSEGSVFLYAKVQPAEGDAYFTTADRVEPSEGMQVTIYEIGFSMDKKVDARRGAPLGLRFTSKISVDGYNALVASEDVTDIKLGTIITPKLQVVGSGDFDLEVLTENYGEKAYIDVPATPGEWYNATSVSYTFAGSIANIKTNHYNTEFTAISYITLTLSDEQVVTVYSDYNPERSNTFANAAATAIKISNLDERVRDALKVVAEAKKEMEDLYKEELKGLNVLAIGDSLFSGSQSNYLTEKQWVNKLGVDLEWNLTNLGIGGATISYTPKNATAGKKSIWHLIDNGLEEFEWGSTNSNYVTVGQPSGDPNDVDLIIIEAGCNDYGYAVAAPLGDVDSFNTGTFLGAYNSVLDYLLSTYENAHIIILTTWELGNQTRDDNLESVYYSRSVIRLYNANYKDNDRVSLIDAGNPLVSGVNMRDGNWRSTYSFDSYHLNDKGMELMAANMLPLIWNNYTNAQ